MAKTMEKWRVQQQKWWLNELRNIGASNRSLRKKNMLEIPYLEPQNDGT